MQNKNSDALSLIDFNVFAIASNFYAESVFVLKI